MIGDHHIEEESIEYIEEIKKLTILQVVSMKTTMEGR